MLKNFFNPFLKKLIFFTETQNLIKKAVTLLIHVLTEINR